MGVAWQHPVNDWGDEPGGFDLTGAEKLTFWARGAEGGERLDFGVGLIGDDKPYPDSMQVRKENVKLRRRGSSTPSIWMTRTCRASRRASSGPMAGQGRTLTFYLDDIQFE